VSNLCSPDSAVKMKNSLSVLSLLEQPQTPVSIPKLDGASDIGVKLREKLPSTGHVMGGVGVEAPPVSLVIAEAVAEDGVCSRLIKVEESRCGRCRWR
jgi:hypothetical protein